MKYLLLINYFVIVFNIIDFFWGCLVFSKFRNDYINNNLIIDNYTVKNMVFLSGPLIFSSSFPLFSNTYIVHCLSSTLLLAFILPEITTCDNECSLVLDENPLGNLKSFINVSLGIQIFNILYYCLYFCFSKTNNRQEQLQYTELVNDNNLNNQNTVQRTNTHTKVFNYYPNLD